MSQLLSFTLCALPIIALGAAFGPKGDEPEPLEAPPHMAVQVADLVDIPAGTFQMGSSDGFSDERPVHAVSVDRFFMDRTETTVGQYRTCVQAQRCSPPGTGQLCNWTSGSGAKENHPVNCVDWNQASGYCAWVGKRLPTEEEWEYAARGTDGRTYPWGNQVPSGQLCWNRTGRGTCAVGSYPEGRSFFGLEDMVGNVWEWTSSQYGGDYSQPRNRPTRVTRGGSWLSLYPAFVRTAYRTGLEPTYRDSLVGFRCVR